MVIAPIHLALYTYVLHVHYTCCACMINNDCSSTKNYSSFYVTITGVQYHSGQCITASIMSMGNIWLTKLSRAQAIFS